MRISIVNTIRVLSLCLGMTLCVQQSTFADNHEEPWEPLFNGENLEQFEIKNGTASYRLEDGAIIGTAVAGSPNTFLATKELYTDFILEVEFKMTTSMNSGIQIRSNSIPEYRDGRVHGYQIEMDPSDRSWTGGVYDEARRAWLDNLEDNEAAREARKMGEWNTMRIEAIGDTIKTWVNGVPAAHLKDGMTRRGFIGFQVHSVGADLVGSEVMWRNPKIITENPEKYSKESAQELTSYINALAPSEENGGWKMLWDGETTEGWRSAKSDQFPKTGWVIEDGVLTVLETGGGEAEAGGDIVTTEQFAAFDLMLEFKITPGANSGIKYFVDTELNKGEGSSIGLEYQILDDERHPDAKLGNHEGSRTVASLYDLIQADPERKYMNPIGEWNHARIYCDGTHTEHWLNGRKVLEYERGSENFRKLVSESKYEKWPSFGELPKGEILLQDHGNRVSFRTIKIKPMEPK